MATNKPLSFKTAHLISVDKTKLTAGLASAGTSSVTPPTHTASGDNGDTERRACDAAEPEIPYRDQSDISDRRVSLAVPPSKCQPQSNLPEQWRVGLEKLFTIPRPAGMPPRYWGCFLADVAKFAEGWAAKAAALGWSIFDAFGCDRHKPYERIDRAGFVWLMGGCEIIAIGPTSATIKTPGNKTKILHWTTNALPGRVLAWELSEK